MAEDDAQLQPDVAAMLDLGKKKSKKKKKDKDKSKDKSSSKSKSSSAGGVGKLGGRTCAIIWFLSYRRKRSFNIFCSMSVSVYSLHVFR